MTTGDNVVFTGSSITIDWVIPYNQDMTGVGEGNFNLTIMYEDGYITYYGDSSINFSYSAPNAITKTDGHIILSSFPVRSSYEGSATFNLGFDASSGNGDNLFVNLSSLSVYIALNKTSFTQRL